MKKFFVFVLCTALFGTLHAQDKKATAAKESRKNDLPPIMQSVTSARESLPLFAANMSDHSQEHDVNSIILDIEKYIDSMPKNRTHSDQLLMKQFNPLRHFFLTTTNKTSVATSFLYSGTPYSFCMYNDTALALYIGAIKDGESYDLSKKTETLVTKLALQNCLLPSLKALDELKETDIKYIGLSIYYGCKDTREGAPNIPATSYCLTLIARLADVQQYIAGIITSKGLLGASELYLSGADEQRKVQVNIE